MIIALTSCWTNKAMAYVSLWLERLSAFQWSSSKTSWICIFPQQSLTPLVGRSSILGHSQKRWVCKWGLEGDERRLKEWERRQATSPLPCPASQPTLPPRQHSFRKRTGKRTSDFMVSLNRGCFANASWRRQPKSQRRQDHQATGWRVVHVGQEMTGDGEPAVGQEDRFPSLKCHIQLPFLSLIWLKSE